MPEALQSGKPRAFRNILSCALCAFLAIPHAAFASADECAPEPQGEGRVQAALDARTLRLDDGRIVRLAGLAALRGAASDLATRMLAARAIGKSVSLHGDSDAPDRYGRQRAWVFAEGQPQPLQVALAAEGGAVGDLAASPLECRAALAAAENAARINRLGLWAGSQFAKKAESADDISSEIGHFAIVEGRVRSVRMSGGTTYLNFGRRWTEGFAVIMAKAAADAFDAAGMPAKGFEGQRVRVRGFVVRRGGPRIEATSPDQIEVVAKGAATAGTRD